MGVYAAIPIDSLPDKVIVYTQAQTLDVPLYVNVITGYRFLDLRVSFSI